MLDFIAQTRIRRPHFRYWILAVLEIMKKPPKYLCNSQKNVSLAQSLQILPYRFFKSISLLQPIDNAANQIIKIIYYIDRM